MVCCGCVLIVVCWCFVFVVRCLFLLCSVWCCLSVVMSCAVLAVRCVLVLGYRLFAACCLLFVMC